MLILRGYRESGLEWAAVRVLCAFAAWRELRFRLADPIFLDNNTEKYP